MWSDPDGAQSRPVAPPHQEEPAEVVQTLDKDVPGRLPFEGVPGITNWAATPRLTQEELEEVARDRDV